MWRQKELKKRGRHTIKKHYWGVVLICFVMAYVAGAYSQGSPTVLLQSNTKEETTAVNTNRQEGQKSNSDVLEELFLPAGEVMADAPEDTKYTRGVLAGVVNNATASGSVILGVLDSLNQGIFQGKVLYGAILLLGALISCLFWLFVQNTLQVCQCRFFLEASAYEQTSFQRVLFIVRVRKWWNAAKIMFFQWLYTFLWSLTIVGGVVKYFSYLMIPYIVAENPNVTKKEAFALSRRMMHGNKWRAFKLVLSFLGWAILSAVTFGLTGIFYSNGYYTATVTQLYLLLREEALEEKVPHYECMNDRYIGLAPLLPAGMTKMPREYPAELFTIPEQERRQWVSVDYRRNYSLWSIILLFFTFSLIGWLWEVSLHLGTDGFVNRGVLRGPWLPIYGSGGVLVLVLLKKVREHKIATFLLTVSICGVLEYCTSLFLELTQGKKWWDYSGYLLNINGRVCAEGLLIFGLGGCAFIYFAAPMFDELYKKIPIKVRILLCVVLVSAFTADTWYAKEHPNVGKGITDYQTDAKMLPVKQKKNM